MLKLLYTREEAREAISYKRRAFDYLLASGELPIVRHGSRVFVTAEALEAFAKQGDRPRMTPKTGHTHAAEDVAECAESLPALSSEGSEQHSTPGPTDRAQAERNRMLRRRRRASEELNT